MCVLPGTIIFTDGYPSYPTAVRLFGSEHHVVNHSQGFITSEGVHTNRIENLWSHLKQEYRARNGIIKKRIPYFLKEFEWLKKNISNNDIRTNTKGIISILNILKVDL